MDESLVTQFDGTTTAKRARVVNTFDDGSIQTPVKEANRSAISAAVADLSARDKLDAILVQLQVQTGLLKHIATQLGAEIGSDEELQEFGSLES